MRRRAAVLAIIALGVLALPRPARATTSAELDADPTAWQGRVVQLEGELIGDYGKHNDGVWVELNDGPYASTPFRPGGSLVGTNQGIGIRIPWPLFDESWGEPGRYRVRGPIVQVVGVFRYHDPDHLGDTFVDVTQLTLVSPSMKVPGERVEWTWPLSAGAILAGAALLALALSRRRRAVSE